MLQGWRYSLVVGHLTRMLEALRPTQTYTYTHNDSANTFQYALKNIEEKEIEIIELKGLFKQNQENVLKGLRLDRIFQVTDI